MAQEEFEIRELKDEEFEQWFSHCAEVFTSTPRLYFENHWNLDPHRKIEGIFVAIDKTKNVIASTVRKMFLNGEEILVGGIGEVSTKVTYRGKKLASLLLKRAIDYMKSQNMIVSVLHTGAAAPLYSSLGWVNVSRYFLKVPLTSFTSNATMEGYEIKRPDLQNDAELHSLVKLYNSFSKMFHGPFVRDESYWRSWVVKEDQYSVELIDKNGVIQGYLGTAVKSRKDVSTILVGTFAVDPELYKSDKGQKIFEVLLAASLGHFSSQDPKPTHILIPTPIVWREFKDAEKVVETGMMYLVLDNNYQSQIDELKKQSEADTTRHLFWNSDGF